MAIGVRAIGNRDCPRNDAEPLLSPHCQKVKAFHPEILVFESIPYPFDILQLVVQLYCMYYALAQGLG